MEKTLFISVLTLSSLEWEKGETLPVYESSAYCREQQMLSPWAALLKPSWVCMSWLKAASICCYIYIILEKCHEKYLCSSKLELDWVCWLDTGDLVVILHCPGNWKCHSLLCHWHPVLVQEPSGCHFSGSTGSVMAVSDVLPFLAVMPLMCRAALLQWTLILHAMSYRLFLVLSCSCSLVSVGRVKDLSWHA